MKGGRRFRQAVASATCAFFTLSTASVAWAEKPRVVRVAMLDVGGNATADSTDIHYFVEKGIRQSGAKVQLMPLDDVLNAGAQATDIQNVAFGKEALDAGMRAFSAGDCEEALDQLSQAVTYFEQSMAFLDDFDDYVRGLVHQGVCLIRTGAKKPARQVLVKAFTVQSKLKFDRFTGERAVFQAARDEARDKELSSILVSTSPDASRVFVNGGYRGVAPAYRPGLRRGVHFVRVERQGYARVGVKVNTSSGASDAKVSLTVKGARKKPVLESLLPGLRKEFGQEEAGQSTSRLQGLLLVDYVVLLRASGESKTKRVELALYDLVSGRLLNSVEGTTDWELRDKAAKQKVLDLAKKLLSVELQTVMKIVEPPSGGNGGGGGGGGIVTRWWFWTAIGVVVLGTAVGLAVGLQPDEDPGGLPNDGNGAILLRF